MSILFPGTLVYQAHSYKEEEVLSDSLRNKQPEVQSWARHLGRNEAWTRNKCHHTRLCWRLMNLHITHNHDLCPSYCMYMARTLVDRGKRDTRVPSPHAWHLTR